MTYQFVYEKTYGSGIFVCKVLQISEKANSKMIFEHNEAIKIISDWQNLMYNKLGR
jgi:hypothetical protein